MWQDTIVPLITEIRKTLPLLAIIGFRCKSICRLHLEGRQVSPLQKLFVSCMPYDGCLLMAMFNLV